MSEDSDLASKKLNLVSGDEDFVLSIKIAQRESKNEFVAEAVRKRVEEINIKVPVLPEDHTGEH